MGVAPAPNHLPPGSAVNDRSACLPASAAVEANDDEAKAWLRAPRGVGLAMLLALPFWLALAIWLLG